MKGRKQALMAIITLTIGGGCTRGTLTDESTGDPVGGASVNLFKWPPPTVPGSDDRDWVWPGSGGPSASYSTTSNSSTYDGFNWAFDDRSGDCQPPEDVQVDTGTFYRVKFAKSGYDTVFRYLQHNAYDETCQIFDCAQNKWVSGVCKSFEEVKMHRTIGPPHKRLPDIFVDPREMQDHEFQCVQLPSVYNPATEKVNMVGLRVSVGTANVGTGKFHLSQVGPTSVVQLITRSDESEIINPLQNVNFHFHVGHDHFHISDWAFLRLLDSSSSCASPLGVRPAWCDIAEGEKISFCAIDSDSFDDELSALYPRLGDPYRCGDVTLQGISPGKKDTYGKGLPGQAIALGSPESTILPPGTYRLEAEWDPEGNFLDDNELEKSNNRAQITIQIPTFTTSDLSQHNPNCDGDIRECRQGFTQHPQCKDYLACETNADCIEGLTCQFNPNDAEEKFCQI